MVDELRTAPEVARDLGIEAKALRDWLRATYPRTQTEHGDRWYLTGEMVRSARSHFRQR